MLRGETGATFQLYFFTTFYTSILAKPISSLLLPRSNPLGIDWDPAPSPEDGPPLSAHASRNKDLLPAQIGGIVGAYLFSLCVVGVVLLILGRRLRRQVELEARSLEIELVDSQFQGVYTGSTGPTPISPANLRNFSWPSPDKKVVYEFPPAINPDPNAFVFPPKAESDAAPYVYPAHNSIYSHQSNLSIDNKVVEADREMLARDLEDIYAHVMEQEEAKAAGVDVKSMPPPKIPGAPVPASAPSSKSAKHKPSNINVGDEKSVKSHSRASSILSSLTSPRSPKSPKSPRRKGIRGLRISSPIATPITTTFSASDEEPLTPRSYVHRAPPPIPRNQVPYSHSRAASNDESESPTRSIAETLSTVTPTSPQLPPGIQPKASLPALNTRNLHLSLKSDKQNNSASPHSATSPRQLFSSALRPAPSRSSLAQPSSQPKPKPSSQPKPKPSLTLSHSPTTSNSSTLVPTFTHQPAEAQPPTRSLPFRQQYEPPTPSFAPSTKTTVLERVPRSNGPQTAGLRTPFSGGAVPYSPYQPFTPMMPITPRLVTKEDRKRMKKQVPRTPVTEMVGSEDDIWDSGY